MRLTILNRRWWLRFVALRTNRGECDPPTKPNKEIRVDSQLRGEERLEVLIHEQIHAAGWHLLRHLMDLQDAIAADDKQTALDEADAIAWRALALSQELHEGYAGSPLAPAARLPVDCRGWDQLKAADGKRAIGSSTPPQSQAAE